MVSSCGEDTTEEKQEIPNEWKGDEMEFKKSFSLRSEGNSSILISAGSALPFDGKIERNNTISSTSQNFSSGKLNGVSIKKSKDGSWVKAHYKNGTLNGEMIFYSKTGQVRTILNYENGIIKKRKKLDI
jgi:antitoxin component YwqK of YwqJK toxin-antitoxin module